MNLIDTPKVAKELVAHFGNSQAETARALNVQQPTVNGWLRGKHGISARPAIRAEIVTNGEFKASRLCGDLADRPS